MSGLPQQGKLEDREDVAQGIEAAPQAFIGMLQGTDLGKQLVQISELSRLCSSALERRRPANTQITLGRARRARPRNPRR